MISVTVISGIVILHVLVCLSILLNFNAIFVMNIYEICSRSRSSFGRDLRLRVGSGIILDFFSIIMITACIFTTIIRYCYRYLLCSICIILQ